ncbi:type V CRISPR-associated endonuclease Cas1 [Candidatus Gracilibacteria bacterium]|nr:type V CRISPR-associated endonuclease Cas1 [Candidatus Gracilibacteria bacterium]
MLSSPDFMQKQIVIIFSHQLRGLQFANENIIIKEDGKIIEQTSLYKVFCIFLIGEATITTKLLEKLQSFGVSLVLFRKNLRPITTIRLHTNGNIELRAKQYELFGNKKEKQKIANNCISNKILNQENTLKSIRNNKEIYKGIAKKLHYLAGESVIASDLNTLLGIEGNAAKYFFHNFYRDMDWMGRYPRTKIDINNTLLDMGYTYLFHFLEGLLSIYGFDIYEGFFHTRYFQRKSLVCDVQEPFRVIIDKALRKAYNLGQINPKDFGCKNNMYYIKPKYIGKYSYIFSKAILENKKMMYDYVYALYRYVGDSSRPLPYSLIS